MLNKIGKYIISLTAYVMLTPAIAMGTHHDAPRPNIKPFHCGGTEPFWNLNLTSQGFQLKIMSGQNISINPVSPRHAVGMKEDYLRVYTTVINNTSDSATIVIKNNPKGCNDGMSDKLYGYDAVIILPNKVYSGCCNPPSAKLKKKK